ncbi:MAG: RNA polymerase sporulation sigma factor SigG [Eubacteriales bacterium]
MQSNKVEICGVNTSQLALLTHKQQTELLQRIKEGDENARQQFIQGNLRLVLSVIKRFSNRGENMDDLFQIGCIGLIKSIDNFNPELGVRFSTYAVPMIVGEVRRYLRDNNAIRVSRSMRDMAYRALTAKEQLSGKLQRDPTIEEIAKELQVPQEDVVFALEAIHDPVSLYEPVYYDGGDAIYVMDQVKDDKNLDENWLEQIALKEAIHRLNERERKILRLRFFAGRTQMEVAKEVGISQAQVSRLEKTAISHIKKSISPPQ